MLQQAANAVTTQPEYISTLQVLGVVGILLQMILTAIGGWLVKSTLESKEKLNIIYTVLFGPNGNSGFVAEFEKFKTEEKHKSMTLHRVVLRLGAIEDNLGIPRTTKAEQITDAVEEMRHNRMDD